jgi:uncharacterized phiE125 gp8 family phage protein
MPMRRLCLQRPPRRRASRVQRLPPLLVQLVRPAVLVVMRVAKLVRMAVLAMVVKPLARVRWLMQAVKPLVMRVVKRLVMRPSKLAAVTAVLTLALKPPLTLTLAIKQLRSEVAMALSEVITGPAAEPVDVASALQQLRIDDEANGPLLAPKLVAAREDAEQLLGRSLITQTRLLQLCDWPCLSDHSGAIALSHPPVQAVLAIEYWATAGWQTLASSAYTLELLDKLHHLVMPVTGWPALAWRPGPRVKVTYRAGFGDTGEAVPETIRQWIVATAGYALDDPTGASAGPSEFINRRLDAWRTHI